MTVMPQEPPPTTGNPEIDAALAAVAVDDLDIAEQARRLGAAQQVLADVLRASRAANQTSGS